MQIFHLNGKPIEFYVTGLDESELVTLKTLIEKNGGAVTDDEDSIIKFTSVAAYDKQKFPVALIYDVRFIMDSARLSWFPDPQIYRLSPKRPDDYIILHYLYGDDHCKKKKEEKEKEKKDEAFPLLPEDIVIETEEKKSLEERGTQTVDVTILDVDDSQLKPNDETLMEMSESSNSAATKANVPVVNALAFPNREIDESQAVVTESEIINNLPLTGAGDIGEINRSPRDSNEKRPCNVEYELNVRPKLTELMNKQRAMDAARKDLSPSENRPLTRSPRTRTKRNSERLSSESNDSNDERDALEGEPTETTIIAPAEISSQNCIIVSDSNDSNDKRNPLKAEPTETTIIPPVEISSQNCIIVSESNDSNDKRDPLKAEPTETTIIAPIEISSQNNCIIVDISDSPVIDMEIEPNLSAESENQSNECFRDDNSENRKKGEKNGKWKKRISDENRPSTSKDYKSPNKRNDINGAIDKRKKIKANGNHNNVGNKKGKKRLKIFDEESNDSDSDESLKSMSSTSSASIYLTATSSADHDVICLSRASKNRPNRKRSLSLNEAGSCGVVKNKKLNHKNGDGVVKNKKINHSDGNDNKNKTKEKTKTKKPNIHKSSKMMWENSSDAEVICDSDEEVINGDDFYDDDDVDDVDEEAVAREKHKPWENSTAKVKEWRDRITAQLRRPRLPRRPFGSEERIKMIKYLIEHKKIKYAKGLVVWKEMIEEGVLGHRTPFSLQNHFVKFILPNIQQANIDDENMQEFLSLR